MSHKSTCSQMSMRKIRFLFLKKARTNVQTPKKVIGEKGHGKGKLFRAVSQTQYPKKKNNKIKKEFNDVRCDAEVPLCGDSCEKVEFFFFFCKQNKNTH